MAKQIGYGLTPYFDWKDFLKKTAGIAVPVALQNLLVTTGSMIDTMMIARLGQLSVAAVGLCAQFSSLMFSCYWGFVGGGMLFFSQYYGAEDDKGVNRAYGLTLLCMMTVGLTFCILGTCFPGRVMSLYTDKTNIGQIGETYLRIVAFGYPLTVLGMAASALLRCTGQVRVPLYAGLAQVFVNISLNAVLIYGYFGIPAMGVKGAALATVCASAVNILVIYTLAGPKSVYLTAVRQHFRWTREFVKTYFIKCFPILMNELLIGVGNMVINVVLGRQSENAIAALAVFRTLEGMIIGFFAGFSNAASVLVGKEVGAGNPETAYSRAKRITYLCMTCIGLADLTLIAVHVPLLSAMGLHGESLELGYGLLLIYAVASVIRMGNWTQNDVFRSAGDATYGTVMEIVFMWLVLLPLVASMGFLVHAPFLAVFACCYVDEPVRFVLMQRHLWQGKWIRPVTPEGKEAMPEFWKAHPASRRKQDTEKGRS